MKRPRWIAAGIATLVLGGGIVGFVIWRADRERAEEVRALLRTVESELTAGEPDRDSMQAVLRRLSRDRAANPRADLTRAEARLLLRLQRAPQAWDVIQHLALTPGADPEDSRLGAEVLARVHAVSGRRADADQAIALAEEHVAATGSVESVFLAWQLAYRASLFSRFAELRSRLIRDHAGTLPADFAEIGGFYLAEHIARRLGIRGDIQRFRALADGPPEAAETIIGRVLVESEGAAAGATPARLEALADAWGLDTPEELDVLIAMADIATNDSPSIADALDRLREVIAAVPSYLEARHALVIAYYALEQQDSDSCRAQIRWLLKNAPADDVRRSIWESLR